MKKLIIFSLILSTSALANAGVLKGTVTGSNGKPVEYATVVALADSVQRGGTVTDSIGNYTMDLRDGNYEVRFSSVGYETTTQPATVKGNTTLNAEMSVNGVVMKEVNVTASAIRREADRFVMYVEDMPGAIGKDGEELLRDAPGVWINDDQISINGKSGTKVYVNDRELKMNEEQLMQFLRNLKAEEVTKIEVVPQTGAEMSADSTAGIIKITMKKARTDGVMGSVGLGGSSSENGSKLRPNASVNIKAGNWTFTARGSYNQGFNEEIGGMQVIDYADGSQYINDTKMINDNGRFGYVNAGVFYDPNPKNSFGLELYYNKWRQPLLSETISKLTTRAGVESTMEGAYESLSNDNYVDGTFNYILRLDSLGSTLKFIANYGKSMDRLNPINNLMKEGETISEHNRGKEKSDFGVTNISFDFNKTVSSKWNYSAGAKYTLNKLNSDAFYQNTTDEENWNVDEDKCYNYQYDENILGMYAKGGFNAKHFSAMVGLRGEYTKTDNREGTINQDYFDLFPNAFLTYKIDAVGAHSLTASYSRTISRPSFWALNPIRRQISDYFYQTGNPDLKAAYNNNIALTAVFKYKYSLTVWADVAENVMTQGTIEDKEDPRNILFSTVNLDKSNSFGASINLPFQLTKWWSLNANVTYIHQQQRRSIGSNKIYANTVYMSFNTGFQLPKDFYIAANYFGTNYMKGAVMEISPFKFLNASIKKSFANKKWTASVGVENILGSSTRFKTLSEDGSVSTQKFNQKPTFNFSITYNFNVGKAFQAKSIEKNVDESRTQKK